MRNLSHILACTTILATVGTAQLTQEQIQVAGLGAVVNSFDVEGPSGNGLMLGVAHLDGLYYVSGGGGAGVNTVFIFDESGALVGSYPEISTSGFGYRDGATDGTSIMWGCEDGIYVHDTAGNVVTTIMADNGPQTVTSPLAGDGLAQLGIYRGLAYNPSGDGGNGSFWTATFGSELIECSLDGTVLTMFPNDPGWSIYGLAWDPYTETLLCNSFPNAGDLAQIDPTTGDILKVIPRIDAGSAQGGLSPVIRGGSLGWQDNGWDVVALNQSTPDTIVRYRIHLWTQPWRNGYLEARLLTGVNGGGVDDTPVKIVTPGGTMELEIENTITTRRPGWIFLNMGAEALINGETRMGMSHRIQEFAALTQMSNPTGMAAVFMAAAGQTLSVPTPMGLMDQEYVRAQALALNPDGLGGYHATNQMFFQLDLARVVVEAVGSNSFNSDTSSGFFRVTHLAGNAIESVEFDWVNSSNANQSTMEFDTDQGGMADVFEGGNSADPGCEGTYRNGCDVATGLIYDALNTVPASPCDPTANTGWIGTNAGNATDDWRTLQFRFAPGMFAGQTFEFDADTDGGQGTSGGDMEGMVVTITLEGGEVLTGELAVDPENADRSFLRFL